MIKEEDKVTQNLHLPNNIVSKICVKTELKGEIDKTAIIVGNFNIPLSEQATKKSSKI